MLEHSNIWVEPAIRFVGVTLMVFIIAGALRVSARLLGPNGEGDVEEARLRQDARRALQSKERDNGG